MHHMSPELSIQVQSLVPAEGLARAYTTVIPDATRVEWAKTISDWTIKADANGGDMLPRSPEDILGLFNKGHSMVLVGEDGKLLSHAGATFEYPDGSIEVGAVCTDGNEQQKGYATKTVEALLIHLKEMYPDRKLITLANEKSVPLFRKLGGTKMVTAELHNDVWLACKDCRRKPPADSNGELFKCCDTPYNLTNFAERPVCGKVIFDSRTSVNGTNGANRASI